MIRQLTDDEIQTRDDNMKRRYEENQLLELGDRVDDTSTTLRRRSGVSGQRSGPLAI